jgi:SET domain-containing protein
MPARNRRQKKREYAGGLTVCPSPIDGQGCFATICFPRGARVAEYAGEKITRQEARRRSFQQRKKRISMVDSNWSIDGSVGGNGTEYVNHSCEPNCSVIVINGQIQIHARCEIAPGEEITVDYLDAFDFSYRECGCGSEVCRGRGKVTRKRRGVTEKSDFAN